MWLWANDYLPVYTDFWAHPGWSLGWLLFVMPWHSVHFYFVHRFLHIQPLYRWFHSLHHKSFVSTATVAPATGQLYFNAVV